MDTDIYFKLTSGVIGYACWSNNEPEKPNSDCRGVIGCYTFDTNGNDSEGSELDVYDDLSIKSHLTEALELAGYDESYKIITEEEYEDLLEKYQSAA